MSASHATPDAFERLADALREMTRADAAAAMSDRARNVLLDACGSDHRMLVELVLTVRADVAAALASAANGETWETRRAPMVHRLVATRYLQSDIARWLVDVWAYALDVRTVRPSAPAVQHAHDAPAHDAPAHDASSITSASGARARPSHPTAVTAHAPRPAGSRASAGLPGWATSPSRTTRIPRATTTRMTPAELARIQRIERVSLIVLALSVIVGFAAEGWALYSRPVERQSRPPAAAATSEPVTSTANALASATVAMPLVMPLSMPLVSTDSMARTAYGSVAGRYRVEHSQVSVGGSDGCDEVARALALQRPSMEVVEHTMGSTTIRWTTRGLVGVIEPDGRFSTGPDSGVTDGVHWTFSMSGRFSRDGFVAQTQKTTDAVLAWHKTRTCSVVATVNGTRVGG